MRLVCPNCSAQYEIDASMIPDEGRDVQCSNCGHTWFELPPPASDMEELTAEDFTASDSLAPGFDDDSDTTEPDVEEATGYSDTVAADAEEDDDPERTRPVAEIVAEAAAGDDEDTDEDGDLPMPGAMGRQRRPADAAALDLLREEAERELSQRRSAQTENLETQADLGLDDLRGRGTPSRALRARMAHLGEEDALDEIEEVVPERVPTAPTPRVSEPQPEEEYEPPQRDLLPDIDEINSTLKSTRGRKAEAGDTRGGFRSGFFLMLLIAAGLIVTYAQAPAIARAMPGIEDQLISYVDMANKFRDWLAGLING